MTQAYRLVTRLLIGASCVAILAGAISTRADELPRVTYALTEASTYQEGCFEPCMCPMLIPKTDPKNTKNKSVPALLSLLDFSSVRWDSLRG